MLIAITDENFSFPLKISQNVWSGKRGQYDQNEQDKQYDHYKQYKQYEAYKQSSQSFQVLLSNLRVDFRALF